MLGSFVTNSLFGTQPWSGRSNHGSAAASSTTTTNASSEAQSIVACTTISLEYASLRHANHCPLGIYVIPSPVNLFIWDVVLFVHQGLSLNGCRQIMTTHVSTVRILHRCRSALSDNISQRLPGENPDSAIRHGHLSSPYRPER